MQQVELKPVLLATFAATIWGLWWVPIRWLEAQGLSGAMGGIAMNAGAFLAGLIWMFARRIPLQLGGHALLGTALAGAAVGSYSVALVYGDVVRVVLLFYLAPAWSKIIEWTFLGQPWRWASSVALVAAFTGAVLVLGGAVSFADLSAGDLVAVVSGLFWACGAALVFTAPKSSPASLTVTTALAAALIGVPFVIAEGAALPPVAPVATGLAAGVVYVLPILGLTLWSARILPPATLTFLLTAEIVAGVVSGALFLDEPFGPLQIAGAALIILAALSELLPRLRPAATEESA
ncbi:DMT family transporter [Jhaorihella thermophila]|uniref:EamA-like transporter family protein n=1 Tax=Jhaorihella thermophila TaxID=488547 RepID=A0A1H5V4H8_9RHOB|nr:DMT family transporter [Jhaorihella thermophila]SEF82209.1 EamA-like transporter family protein [Jhaorihella thermophila]